MNKKRMLQAAGFLGVSMECDSNTGLLEMKQTGLIGRVIEALGLDDGDIGAMVSYIFSYRDSRTIRML